MYLGQRARRRLSRGLLLLALGLTLVIAGFLSTQGPSAGSLAWLGGLPVFLGFGGTLVGALQLLAASRDRDAMAGEAPVVGQLRARFGDEYAYLYRVRMPHGGAEADGILLGPHGALVVAIRAMSQRLAVRGDDWFSVDAGGGRRPLGRSPTWELARPLRSMQRLVRTEGLGNFPVQGAVVLVEARLIEAEQPSVAVVPLDRIATYVEYLRTSATEVVPPELVERLLEALQPRVGGAERQALK
jgi:hypothetical protein